MCTLKSSLGKTRSWQHYIGSPVFLKTNAVPEIQKRAYSRGRQTQLSTCFCEWCDGNTAVPIAGRVLSGCFCAALRSWDRECVTAKPDIRTAWSFTESVCWTLEESVAAFSLALAELTGPSQVPPRGTQFPHLSEKEVATVRVPNVCFQPSSDFPFHTSHLAPPPC